MIQLTFGGIYGNVLRVVFSDCIKLYSVKILKEIVHISIDKQIIRDRKYNL